MRSKPVALLLADLGVTKTHSRPHVSNDNPYSEAHFKTLKYRPGFPDRFGSIEDARAFCRHFFPWYNEQHRHCGIGLMTPATSTTASPSRPTPPEQHVLSAAYAATPSASSAAHPSRRRCRPARGSTSRPTPRNLLTKFLSHLSHRA